MNKKTLLFLGVVVASMLFVSCSDDDDNWSSTEVTNTELKAVLQQKGFEFNEQGELVQDDVVENTTTLDLSGCDLSDVSGLDVFPNLTEVNLSDNNFSFSFDFSMLPATVNSVDLTNNEIYEYPGLVEVETEENGDETVTVLHEITKLYLPESAKYNTQELPVLYEQREEEISNGTVEMTMGDTAYTVLRDVPDDNFRAFLKESFPSLFDGEQINLTNRIVDLTEAEAVLYFDYRNVEGVENVEGAQYIFSHRAYKGAQIWLVLSPEVASQTTVPFFKIYYEGVASIGLSNINTPNGIDFGNAAPNICGVTIANNDEITSLDLSQSEMIGQRSVEVEFLAGTPSHLHIESCPLLEELNLLPEEAVMIRSVELHDLPKLKKLDLSQLDAIGYAIRLSQLPECEITYITPKKWRAYYKYEGDEMLLDYGSEYAYMNFGITEDIYDKQATKDFLETYSSRLKKSGITSLNGNVVNFDWRQHYEGWTRP